VPKLRLSSYWLAIRHSSDESIADEGLHLAVAMQYCGFRSVVGTMWAVADTDGQFLAENFYKQVFSSRKNWQGLPYYERTAKALRNAENGMTLER
jgi:CHAT domain-containing protein